MSCDRRCYDEKDEYFEHEDCSTCPGRDDEMKEKEYYIICKRHAKKKDRALLFWRTSSCGYTYNAEDAGVYSEKDIERFANHADDQPIQKDLIDSRLIDAVIDKVTIGKICVNCPENRKALGIKLAHMHPGETHWGRNAFTPIQDFIRENAHMEALLAKARERLNTGMVS